MHGEGETRKDLQYFTSRFFANTLYSTLANRTQVSVHVNEPGILAGTGRDGRRDAGRRDMGRDAMLAGIPHMQQG